MDTWIDDLAAALTLQPLSEEEADHLLLIARDVAHQVERKGTPLATFLLGMHVANRVASGSQRDIALGDAIDVTRALLPPAPDQP
ncbi:MAG: DUF6457 domain-containing protein [Actinomycetota bacterium]